MDELDVPIRVDERNRRPSARILYRRASKLDSKFSNFLMLQRRRNLSAFFFQLQVSG